MLSNNVQSIIDAFEIEIEQSSDPKKLALTYFNYTQRNILKYIIFVISDGFINFVSEDYGGRTSDIRIVQI